MNVLKQYTQGLTQKEVSQLTGIEYTRVHRLMNIRSQAELEAKMYLSELKAFQTLTPEIRELI